LYDGVVSMLDHLADNADVLVVLDDIQWLDERSVALLHYAVRNFGTHVPFLASARPRELAGNEACRRALDAMRRENLSQQLPIGPLAAAVIGELAHGVAPRADVAAIVSASNGNPLFAIEMARALARGDDPFTGRVDALIGDRLARLSAEATDLVPYLAAFGRGTKAAVLADAYGRSEADLVAALAELEEHGVLVAAEDRTYDFVHDLVRDAAYRRLPTALRAMLHGRIGRALNAAPDPDDILAADAARHAHAADDSATCAAASLRAARRCVRLLAYDEAEAHVELGRAHTRQLPRRHQVEYDLRFIDVLLHPALRLRNPGTLGTDLAELCALAQQLEMSDELATGLTLLATVHHWGWGDVPRAEALLQRARDVIESSERPVVEPLLHGARCLAYLEMDMPRTRDLFAQLSRLGALAEASHEYHWGRGLVLAWDGDLAGARQELQQAITQARFRHDHWAAFECSARLALLEIESGNQAEDLLDPLDELAERLGPSGSEAAYARAIRALASDRPDLLDRIDDLLRLDARLLVPDLLGLASEHHYRAGDLGRAHDLATRALEIATSVHRPAEEARAHGLLACIAAARDQQQQAREHLMVGRDDHRQWSAHVNALREEADKLVNTLMEETWL
jgi:tetratricopeptide (TPR) repeat protein